MRSIFLTTDGEVRYFIIGEAERIVRATGVEDGGLKIERYVKSGWEIDATATDPMFNGESICEISEDEVNSLII